MCIYIYMHTDIHISIYIHVQKYANICIYDIDQIFEIQFFSIYIVGVALYIRVSYLYYKHTRVYIYIYTQYTHPLYTHYIHTYARTYLHTYIPTYIATCTNMCFYVPFKHIHISCLHTNIIYVYAQGGKQSYHTHICIYIYIVMWIYIIHTGTQVREIGIP